MDKSAVESLDCLQLVDQKATSDNRPTTNNDWKTKFKFLEVLN